MIDMSQILNTNPPVGMGGSAAIPQEYATQSYGGGAAALPPAYGSQLPGGGGAAALPPQYANQLPGGGAGATATPPEYASSPQGGYPPTNPAFPYPPEWDVASGTYGRYSTGQPTTAGGWREAQMPMVQRRIEDQAKQAAEMAGLGGTRWSSPLQRNVTDIAGREMGQLEGDWATKQWQARESGADRALQSAGGLGQLGQRYFQAPMDWSRQMYGMGTGQQQIAQQGYGRQYQDFLRMAQENDPWLSQGLGYAGLQNQLTPQQYQPGGGTQVLGALSSMLPLLGFLL